MRTLRVLPIVLTVVTFARCTEFDLVAEESNIYEEGAGKSYDSAKNQAKGEAGNRGYVAQHARADGLQGHLDKERHQKAFAEEGGHKNSHRHDDGYYKGDQKSVKASKGYDYADKGSYAKGHDTKGHHNVHKLDEFQKTKEFFDEDYDGGYKEKEGAFLVGKAFKKGAVQKGGKANAVYYQSNGEKKSKAEKGASEFEEAGVEKSAGRDKFFKDVEEFAKKGGGANFKDFGFSNWFI